MTKNNRSRNAAESTRVPFKCVVEVSGNVTGSTTTGLDLHLGNLGVRLAQLQKDFRRWRFSKPLKVRSFLDTQSVVFWAVDNSTPSDNTVGNQGLFHSSGFYGAPIGTLNATTIMTLPMDYIWELVHSDLRPSQAECKFSVPLKALRAAQTQPWLLTDQAAESAPFAGIDSAGVILFGFFTAQGFPEGYPVGCYLALSGEVEFGDPIPNELQAPVPRAAMQPPQQVDTVSDDEKEVVVVRKAATLKPKR